MARVICRPAFARVQRRTDRTVTTKTTMETMADSNSRVQKFFLTLGVALVCAIAPRAWATPNNPPTFASVVTNLSVYRGAGATSFKALAGVSDPDVGQT